MVRKRASRNRSAATRRDARFGARPASVNALTGLVEIEQERRVIRRDGLTLARFAINLRPDDALREALGDEQVIDAHALILWKATGAVVPPRKTLHVRML